MRAYRSMSDYLLQALAQDTVNALRDAPTDRYLKRQLRLIGKVQAERRRVLDFYASKYNPNY